MTNKTCFLVTVGLLLSAAEVNGQLGDLNLLAEYRFEGSTVNSAGTGFDGELVGDATLEEGRLLLPGGLDNSMQIPPFGDYSPFSGVQSWRLSFEFQSVDGSLGALFSADGSAQCDDDPCRELWPGGDETGDQTGSLNIFLGEDGAVRTDFWFIDVVASADAYDDDEVHSYVGEFDAESGEFLQIIDGEDEAFGVFFFERDASNDRNLVGDESNGDFGFEFNPEGFNGYIDNLIIETSGEVPEATPNGDFNRNGVLDLPDVNMLNAEIASGANTASFDLNADMLVDDADLTIWVKDLKKTFFGDANLDGEFSTLDLVDVLQLGKYEQDADAGWHEGDWSGDLRFGTVDLVNALQDGGFEQGPAVATAVPEPAAVGLLTIGVLGLVSLPRRRV